MAWVVPRAHELFVGETHVITSHQPARLLAYRNADDETMMLFPSHVEETSTGRATAVLNRIQAVWNIHYCFKKRY
jgi:hypothetical protein